MKHLIPTLSFLLLTACTSYKEGFDCEAVPGVGCKSIAQVDRLIDEDKLGTDVSPSQERNLQQESKKDSKHLHHATTKGVHIWIAPYSDDEGIMHGSQSLFVPLKPSHEETT